MDGGKEGKSWVRFQKRSHPVSEQQSIENKKREKALVLNVIELLIYVFPLFSEGIGTYHLWGNSDLEMRISEMYSICWVRVVIMVLMHMMVNVRMRGICWCVDNIVLNIFVKFTHLVRVVWNLWRV